MHPHPVATAPARFRRLLAPTLTAFYCGFLAAGTNAADITIDFGATHYPAIPKKIGYNSEWGEESLKTSPYGETEMLKPDEIAARRGELAAAPLVSGLVELNHFTAAPAVADGINDASGAVFGPNPLFSLDGSSIEVSNDDNLISLRASAHDGGLINLLQLCGTPTYDGVFTLETGYMPNTAGNWYPLPVASQMGTFTTALAAFINLVQTTDDIPTMVCFWQEPDHTISGYLPGYDPENSAGDSYDFYQREQSLGLYIDFFKRAGPAVRALNPDIVIAGVQQNASSGIDGGALEGADYKTFADLWLAQESADATTYPLDYVTVQIYKGEKSDEIIRNSRVAFADDRFNTAPLFMNEFHFNKDDSFAMSYNTDAGVAELLTYLHITLEAPDLAYVLLKRNIYVQDDLLAYAPVEFFGRMPDIGRSFTSTNTAIEGFATADPHGATALFWNTSGTPQTVSIDLQHLPAGLVAGTETLTIQTISGGAAAGTVSVDPSSDHLLVSSFTIPAYGIATVQLGAADHTNDLELATYARHMIYTDRRPTSSEAPHGLGHYEIRSSCLLASTDSDSAAVGLAGVVLKDLPDPSSDPSYTIQVDLTLAGLPVDLSSTVLGLRLDYLKIDPDGEGYKPMKSIYYRPAGSDTTDPWNAVKANGWQRPDVNQTTVAAAFTDQGTVTLPISAGAPNSWDTRDDGARRVMVSLILEHPGSASTVLARLRD